MTQKKKRSRFTKAERKIITFIICIFLIGGIVGGGIVAVEELKDTIILLN